MIDCFHRTISLNNLGASKLQGQIATLLMLMMVVVLIFILVTVNLGQISVTTTNVSNAADSASLSLASQLATKSNMIHNSLGATKKCVKGGLASTFLGILGAIIGAILGTFVFPGVGTFWGAVIGGTIGGTAGALYAGTSILAGAIQGFIIGAMIGAGAEGIFGPADAASQSTLVGLMDEGIGGATAADLLAAQNAAYWNALQAALVTPQTGMFALSVGSTLYNASVAEQNLSAAFAAAAKALSGLPEYDRYREGVFLQALSQTVDDPNKDTDTADVDGDGETDDKISHFLNWWDSRINAIKTALPNLKELVKNFVQGTLKDFKDYAKEQYTREEYQEYAGVPVYGQPGPLCRQEVDGADGIVVEVARALSVSFFKPGTPPDCPCETCGETYYDDVWTAVCELKDMVELIEGLLDQDIDQLTYTWQFWIKQFYDPETTWTPDNDTVNADWYDVLKNGTEPELNAWRNEIEDKTNLLPNCTYGWRGESSTCNVCVVGSPCSQDCILNPPCKFTSSGGSTDSDLDDEISNAINAINNLIAKIQIFENDIRNSYNSIKAEYDKSPGGLNPVIYNWTDSRGNHSVTVEASQFKIPSTKNTESGNWLKNEKCIEMVDYYDNNGANTWVKITRQDPANKEIKSGKVGLGMWNPYFDGKITKKSRAYYSFDKVGIAGKD